MYGGSATVRTIQTVFTADDRASAKLEAAERRGDELGDSMERTEQQLGAVTQAMAVTGTAALGGAAAIAALTSRFGRLDQQFATIQSTSGATVEQMEQIRAAAKGVSTSLPVSLRESTAAARELSYAGLSASETMATLSATSQLAVAGNLQAGQAAQTVARSLNAFELEARQVDAVVGSLGQTFASSATSVNALTQGLSEVQATANAAGLSVAETTASLGLLASSGLSGSRGGTALNSTLQQLTSGSGKTKEALDELGLSMRDFTDESGNLQDLPVIMQTLSTEMNNVESQAERLRIANELVGAEGSRALLPMIRNTSDLANRVQNNLRAEIQGAVGDLAEMSDSELSTTGELLGMGDLSAQTTTAELVANLQQLEEEGETTAQITARLESGLGLTSDAAQLLARDITETDKSAKELADSIGGVATAEELAEAQTRTLSGQVQQLRSDLQVLGYEMYQGTKPATQAVVGGLRSITTPLAQNETAARALGAGLVGLTGVLGVATLGLGAHVAQLKLAILMQQGYASSTAAGTAALWAHSAATTAASKAQWLMTASAGQLALAIGAKTGVLAGEVTALWASTTAALSNATAMGIMTGAVGLATTAVTALWTALGPIGLLALGITAAVVGLAGVMKTDLFGAGDKAAAAFGWLGDQAATAWAIMEQGLGILYELGRIGATLGGLALIAPFAALLKLPDLISGAGPKVKKAASKLPSQILAGLNSLGPGAYSIPILGNLLLVRDLLTGSGMWEEAGAQIPSMIAAGIGDAADAPVDAITGVVGDQAATAWAIMEQGLGILYELGRIGETLGGLALIAPFAAILKLPGFIQDVAPQVKEAAMQLPSQVVAGLNSMGRWKYLVPVVGPLLGLHEVITGLGPRAKEAAMQLPSQIVAGLNSMGRWKYLVPILGPLMFVRDVLTNPQEWREAGAQIPNMIAAGIGDAANAPVDAVTGVVGDIRSRLPFSPAKEGPLQDIDKTGPALVSTIADGVESEGGQLTSALEATLGRTPLGMAAGAAADAATDAAGSVGGQQIEVTVNNEIVVDGSGDVSGDVETAAQRGTSTALDEFLRRLSRETNSKPGGQQ